MQSAAKPAAPRRKRKTKAVSSLLVFALFRPSGGLSQRFGPRY